MKNPHLHFALRELRWVLRQPHLWMAFGIVVTLFALTGPFGTYQRLALHERIGYWLLIISVGFSPRSRSATVWVEPPFTV